MKKAIILLIPIFFLTTSFISTSELKLDKKVISKFSLLTESQQKEFIKALKDGDCQYNDIDLWGKVKFVDTFPDITIEYVSTFEDIRVKFVDVFPDRCGKWKEVDVFPDFTVKVVDVFPDIKVKKVDTFPGMD